MESHNTTTCSTIRTDYGSTTLEISFDDNGSSSFDIAGYQSLPCTSSERKLFAKSSVRSRFSKMSVDTTGTSTAARSYVQRVEFFVNVFNQICIGFVTIYMSWLCLRLGLAKTALHAWLVTVGFVFLMAEAIMCHYNNNVLTFNYRRTTKTTIHWVLQVLGGGSGITGVLIKCIQDDFRFRTLHGKLGLAALVLCCISMLSGVAALFSMEVKRLLSPLLNKAFHNIVGIGSFVVAIAAQYYGYNSGFFSRKTPSEDFTILIKVLTLMIVFLSCWGPLKALYSKICNIVRQFT